VTALWWRTSATPPAPSVAHLTAVHGQVQRVDSPTRAPSIGINQPLRAGDTVAVGSDGETLVAGDQGIHIAMAAQSTLTLGTMAAGIAATLLHGEILVEVPPQRGPEPVTLVAGGVRIEVVGTLFTVSRADEAIAVTVLHGSVRVVTPKTAVLLKPGESFTTPRQAPPSLNPLLLRFLVPEPPTPTAQPAPAPTPAATPTTPLSATRRPLPPLTATAPEPERLEAAVTQPTAAERLYAQAELSRDPNTALALFDEVAAGPSPWAELAAYRAARLATSLMDVSAISRYAVFLQRFPDGTFAAEAWLSLVELYTQAGDDTGALQAIASFVDKFPSNERVPELRFIRAEILRTVRNACAQALADYQAVPAQDRHAEAALYGQVRCLGELRRPDERRLLLERYLTQYPHGQYAEAARSSLLHFP